MPRCIRWIVAGVAPREAGAVEIVEDALAASFVARGLAEYVLATPEPSAEPAGADKGAKPAPADRMIRRGAGTKRRRDHGRAR